MGILEKLERDLQEAMKAREADRVSTLRMVKSAAGYYKIEKKKEKLEDADLIEILKKQVKQRRESIEGFEKAGRAELAAKEKKELSILQSYLPQELTDEEIRELARKAVAAAGASSKADLGKVMKELMPLVKGRADGRRVNEIAAALLP